MDQHTLRVLEFGKVIARLAAFASNGLGREAAMALAPSPHPEQVRRALQETREMRALLDEGAGPPLGGIHDVREPVARAALGNPLVPAELLEVASTAGSARRLRTFLEKRAETCPLLAEMAANLPLLNNVERKVEEAIAGNGEVRDSATPELARVRGQIRTVQARLREKLNSILVSPRYAPYIQESLITLREGRYCIPVKAENRAQFGGIVHDASASGATVFVEPGPCVEMGNDLRELTAKEEHEVYRILARLTEIVGREAEDIRRMLGVLADLDRAHAKALLACEMRAADPRLNERSITRLFDARHPLLTGEVQPIDVEIGDRFTILLITGPNTGGKTVTLKTVGLLTLMAQAGMQIPASADSEIAIFRHVFADIGDEQDIQQSLSTFSAHLRNITRIVQEIDDRSLVLLDEVGAGTDPAEGAALAKALLKRMQEAGARVIATTHYGELKEYAFAHPGVENASVEFDRETLRPTYRVLIGVPGSSNAFYIAGRLGLPNDLIDSAGRFLSTRDQTSAEIIQQIEESRRRAFDLEREAARARQEAAASREEYQTRAREVADLQRTVRRQAEDEARTLLRRTSDRAENILEELRRMNRGARKGPAARRQLTELRRETLESLGAEEEAPVTAAPLPEGHVWRRGDRAMVITLSLEGELLADPEEGHVPVQVGAMRATLPVDVLRPAVAPVALKRARRSEAAEISLRKEIHISPELMLRAMRVDEAASLLEKYLDDAYAAGIATARIIHGRGTGALRKLVWDHLKGSPVVRGFRFGDESEGGDGVTLVEFKE